METYYSKITSKGQITIPKEILNKHKLMHGQMVTISERDNIVTVEIPPSIDEIRKQFQSNLKREGFTKRKLREMAEAQQNGNY